MLMRYALGVGNVFREKRSDVGISSVSKNKSDGLHTNMDAAVLKHDRGFS